MNSVCTWNLVRVLKSHPMEVSHKNYLLAAQYMVMKNTAPNSAYIPQNNPRVLTHSQSKIRDLCHEDKMKIGKVVKTLTDTISQERKEKEEFKRKYEEAMKEFSQISATFRSPVRDTKAVTLLNQNQSHLEHHKSELFLSNHYRCMTSSNAAGLHIP